MSKLELSISVEELLGVAKVSLSGNMGPAHDQAIQGILAGFREQGATSLVLDMAGLTLSGIDTAAGIINVLRSLGPALCIHVVASGLLGTMLNKVGFGPYVKVYSSVDDLADTVWSDEEYLTSRWMAPGNQDTELPLAA